MSRYQEIDSREAVHAYFQELLALKGEDAQDIHRILPLMQSELFPFRTVAERFHLIENPTVTIYIPLDEGAELIQELRSGQRNRNIFRKLGQYGVSIYEQHFAKLDRAGDLERLEGDVFVLSNLALYAADTGLSLEADSGKGLFI